MEIAEGSGMDRALDGKYCGKLKTRPCPGEFIMLCQRAKGVEVMDFMSGKIEPRDAEFGDLTAGERSPALGSEHLLSSLLVLGSASCGAGMLEEETSLQPLHTVQLKSQTQLEEGAGKAALEPSLSCSVGERQKRT